MSEVSSGAAKPSAYSRKNPFLAELKAKWPLTKPGSEKETLHFIIDIRGSGLVYTPGDSLGIFARNPAELVDEVISLLGMDPAALVKDRSGASRTFWQALSQQYILNRANKKILAGMAERILQGEQRNRLMEIVDNDEVSSEYIHGRDYVDVLREFTDAVFETPDDFIAQLSPIPPRLYSVASSQTVFPNEVHLCVAVVRYEAHGRSRKGLATGFLADHTEIGARDIPVFVQESRTFRLPRDNATDIIMVGPGTGIAPFRAFLQQRVQEDARGRNWLIFGEQHRATDFFYEEEFTEHQKKGKLHQLDLAFSRDQAKKVYVQHRMQENSKRLWDWLQNGAYFYVCGDAKRMAKDVHQALIAVAEQQGGLTREAAVDYVENRLMRSEKRYLRDVY